MEDEQGGFEKTEKGQQQQQHQSLFPIASTKDAPSSTSVTVGTLFPSFASAPSVISVVDTAEMHQQQQQSSSGLEWLSNSTFSETLLYQPAASAPVPSIHPSGARLGFEFTGNESRAAKEQTSVRALASSSTPGSLSEGENSQTDSSTERRHRKKLKRRKDTHNDEKLEKRRNRQLLQQNDDTRKTEPLDLVSSERRSATNSRTDFNTRNQKEYYFDSRGDRDSLAFGSLYRMDIAKYHRSEIIIESGSSLLDVGGLRDADDSALRAGVDRYWSLKLSSLERRRKLKLLRIGRDKSERSGSGPLSEFVALEDSWLPGEKSGHESPETKEGGETWAEYVALKTRDLNKLTRERQHDESAWISFANFQDELIRATNSRAAVQNLVAKKIAILEKALNSISDSEDLLIVYLETCKRSDDANTLLGKWERAVHFHAGSLRIWQEYIRFRCTQFSSFTVSALRSLYNDAIRALSAARNQLFANGSRDTDDDFLEAEGAIVSMFVDLCRFNWQAGHHERAVGLFQAEIEFSSFGPSPMQEESETIKLERFEKFWRSGARRFGEDGARGWATFVEVEDEDQKFRESQNYGTSQLEEEVQPGGWTGWTTPGTEVVELNGTGQPLGDDEGWNMEGEEVELDGDQNLRDNEDDATLLEKLGLRLNSFKDVEVDDSRIWKRWSEKERDRDREHWLPSHSRRGEYSDDEGISNDDEGNELEQMVLYDDVKGSLFSLQSQQARLSLIYQFLEFFDGLLPQWCCSNSDSCTSQLYSMQNLKEGMIHDLFGGNWSGDTGENALVNVVRSSQWYRESEGRKKFIQNCLGLAKSVFPRDQFLLRGLLNVEETGYIGERNRDASRILAKKLLKTDRKNLLLWAAYASVEGVAGNITAARTVFDTTLASLGSGSEQDAPIIYLAYVELELGQSKDVERDLNAEHKALYILSHLGSGITYVPQSHQDGPPAGTMLLKAHRGFSEQLRKVRMSDRGNLSERGAAVITCAAIFEQLMNGWDAGIAVFEEGLAMTLPEKRQQSLQCELLFLRYMQMLEKSDREGRIKPSRFRSVLFRGLAQYPRNTKLISTRVRDGFQSVRSWDLRRYLDDTTSQYSSPTLWLFALSWEMGKRGAGPRIHRLFERGLENKDTQHSVLLWRSYLAYEIEVASNPEAARRVYFRAIHACPWSKALWMDGFFMLHSILSAKELSEFVDVMRDKELRLQTDVYEILLEDEG